MGKLGGFLQIERHGVPQRDPSERARDYREFLITRPVEELREQGARCMDCGVPFCHNGCPLGNLIPDWNDLVYRDRFRDAIAQLHATNNFPEFTGRLCPAPCEAACVLEIREGDAVTIKQIENSIINRAWEEGWVVPRPPRRETGQSVAVIGSGPAGMAAAQQLRRAGHAVTLFERDEAPGGLVRFGVPDFKIEKRIVQRRVEQLIAEGVELRCGVDVGADVGAQELRGSFDAVVLATGSRVPRDLPVPGRELDGVHFAMDYLYQRNRFVAREQGPEPAVAQPAAAHEISAADKDVVVIGGGDTGADCVGNALREGARSIVQLELLPEPPAHRPDDRTPWPRVAAQVPAQLRDGGGQRPRRGRAGLLGHDHQLRRRRGRAGRRAAPRAGGRGASVRPGGGHRARAARAARAARDGLPAPRARPARAARRGARRARQREEHGSLHDQRRRACSPPATRAADSR